MKRGRPSTGGGGNSRNADYYVKKIRSSDSRGSPSIMSFFTPPAGSKQEQQEDISSNASEISDLNQVAEDEVMISSFETEVGDTVHTANIKSSIMNKIIEEISSESDTEFEDSSASLSAETQERCESNDGKYIAHYESLYSWLYYSHSASGFLCKKCSVVHNGIKKPWISIGVNLKKKGGHPSRVIKKHEDSKQHKQTAAIQESRKKGVVEKILEGTEAAKIQKIIFNRKLFSKFVKILYFMVKKQWAVSENFESLVRFLGENLDDMEIKQHINCCSKNATYLSHISVQNMLSSISTYIEQKTITEIQCSDFFAIMADESTDECQREQLGLIIRYKVKGDKSIREKYLGLINLTATTAEAIMTAIEKIAIAKNVDLSNCLFIALDGTNVMSGEHAGVQRRMKQYSPHCIYINCRNHRLALVFAHLLKKYDILHSVDSLLISLWKLFHYSPKKAHVFKDIQENVYGVNILKTMKVSTTRWLSHGHACSRISARYQQLIETLDSLFIETKEPEIRGLREQMVTPEIILTILFLADFLAEVDKLNLWLQSPAISFSLINTRINHLIEEVEKYCSNLENGRNFKKSKELLEFVSREFPSLSMKTRGKKQPKKDLIAEYKENFVKKFLNDFKEELKIAFEVSAGGEVLQGFEFFNNVNSTLSSNACQEGKSVDSDTCLSLLLSYYGEEKSDTFQISTKISKPVIDKVAAESEKEDFVKEMSYAQMTFDIQKTEKARQLLKRDREEAKKEMEKKMTPIELLNLLEDNPSNWKSYPNFMKLLSILMIIPSSTASVERLFSKMNLVCTELRSKMSQENLDRQIRIIVNGPASLSQEECEAIIDIFKSTANHRIVL